MGAFLEEPGNLVFVAFGVAEHCFAIAAAAGLIDVGEGKGQGAVDYVVMLVVEVVQYCFAEICKCYALAGCVLA